MKNSDIAGSAGCSPSLGDPHGLSAWEPLRETHPDWSGQDQWVLSSTIAGPCLSTLEAGRFTVGVFFTSFLSDPLQ